MTNNLKYIQVKFGLKPHTIEAIRGVFIKYPQIDSAILYGSRAKGNFKPNSDIDLTLKGENVDLAMLLKIENELDDLLLPYKMDVSVFRKIENKDLIDHINRVGIVFYDKEKSNNIKVVNE